jgi:acetolactate synthase-1/2/3 large subunit
MFPGLPAVDVADITALPAALRDAFAHAGPSVVSIECSADEIPPFAPFLATTDRSTDKERTADVTARA